MFSHDAENVSWGHFLYKVRVYHGKRTQVPEKRSKWFVWKNERFDSCLRIENLSMYFVKLKINLL